MHRREFLILSAAAASTAARPLSATTQPGPHKASATRAPFQLKYAPHFGMFSNHAKDLLDQLQFAADQGFTAWEDNGMAGRSIDMQERITAKMEDLGMEMGVFIAHADFGKPTFASGRKQDIDRVLGDMKRAAEVAKRVRAKWCTVVPGTIDPRQDMGYQTANAVALLEESAKITGEADLTMVLEPLNFRDHPRLFLTKMAQAYSICRAVNSEHCKILDDLYHQQITEGNLIPNIDRSWDEIAYFQVGDNPGRREPGTGEINYRNVFRHIHRKGFSGIVGMEHGKSQGGKEGELELVRAYREADSFE